MSKSMLCHKREGWLKSEERVIRNSNDISSLHSRLPCSYTLEMGYSILETTRIDQNVVQSFSPLRDRDKIMVYQDRIRDQVDQALLIISMPNGHSHRCILDRGEKDVWLWNRIKCETRKRMLEGRAMLQDT